MFGVASPEKSILAVVVAFVGAFVVYDFCYGDNTLIGSVHPQTKGLCASPLQQRNIEGQWPECLWMSGIDCANYLHTQVPDYVEIDFVHRDYLDEIVSGFDPNQILIVLNKQDNVWEVPARGRRRF